MINPSVLRVAVLQPGARMHYAVPALLERAGMLQRLYTDFCANIGPLRYVERVWPTRLRPKAIRRMLGRTLPPDIPHAKVRQVLAAAIVDEVSERIGGIRSAPALLMRKASAERFGGANAIYTAFINEDLDLCAHAKNRGCRVVHEVIITPDVGLWLNEEYANHPSVPRQIPPLSEIERGRNRDRQKYALADLILVPSEFARRAVLELGADPKRVALVPYGIDESWFEITHRPVRGRVLFIGSVGLRKGNHYLAEAARLLAKRKVSVEVRVIGPHEIDTTDQSLFRGPRYLGQVPRIQVKSEFLAADIFVLPTIAEGSALVTYEAMACGVPVVTTPNSGSFVRDCIDGLIVPVRNPEALADAIERIVTDRQLRATMSANARERAREFTWTRYGARLISVLSRLEPTIG